MELISWPSGIFTRLTFGTVPKSLSAISTAFLQASGSKATAIYWTCLSNAKILCIWISERVFPRSANIQLALVLLSDSIVRALITDSTRTTLFGCLLEWRLYRKSDFLLEGGL